MLNNDSISDRIAFERCGIFPDPERAYLESKKEKEEKEKKALENAQKMQNASNSATDDKDIGKHEEVSKMKQKAGKNENAE